MSSAVIKVKLRAVIGEVEFSDVTMFTSSFALNSIPQAAIQVAVGRNVQNNQPATIHEALKTLKKQQRAEVYLRTLVTDQQDVTPGVPKDKEIKIFDGKVVGIGYQRATRTARFMIHLLHWLGDINYSSAISASSHPGNPANLTYPATFAAIGGKEGEAGTLDTEGDGGGENLEGPAWVPIVSKSLVNESNLSDIWGSILWKWMNTVASDDPFELNLLGGQPGGGDENTLRALSRMGPNPDGAPLNVDFGGANPHVIAEGLRQALMNETGGNWINTTLWGKLIGEWSPAYLFSVVPRVDDCLIVPFTGPLSGEPWAVIGEEDYDSADVNGQIHQVLRAVGIVYPTMFVSGVAQSMGTIPLDRGGFAGFYQPPDVTKGMVLVKSPPGWLSDPLVASEFSFCAEGIDGSEIGSTVDETCGDECDLDRDLSADQQSQREAIDNFAHQWYVLEMLKGCVAEVSGKLRFDIAPGSNVKLRLGGAKNLQSDLLREDVYGTVVSVTYMIDSENRKAATGFSLAHIRTEKENGEEGTSVDKPPMYKDAWRGAKLVNDVSVIREET